MSSLAAVAAQFAGGSTAPSPVKQTVAEPGTYAGMNGQNGYGITFDVAPGGTRILAVSDTATYLSCTPSGAVEDHLGMLQVPVSPNGSFASKSSQTGVINGSAATFTYTIAGRFEPATASTLATAAGTWSETIGFASGNTKACTSNSQSWSATLDREPPQPRVAIEPGDYSGKNGQNGYGIKFSVGSGGAILNVSDPSTYLACAPSGAMDDHLGILQLTVKPDGSFAAKDSQTGVVNGSNAHFTFTFTGYFEGLTPAGASTVAGIWREDVVFSSGSTKMCTSNDQSFTAVRG